MQAIAVEVRVAPDGSISVEPQTGLQAGLYQGFLMLEDAAVQTAPSIGALPPELDALFGVWKDLTDADVEAWLEERRSSSEARVRYVYDDDRE